MKRIIITLSLVVATITATMAQQANEFKMGFVNMEYIFLKLKQTPALKAVESELNTYVEQKKMQLQAIDQRGKDLEAQYQRATTEAEQKGIMAEYQGVQARYESMQTSVQQEMMQKEKELMNPTIEKINTAIKKVGETNNYTYVLTDGLAGNSIVLFSKNKGDNLTTKVLAELGITVTE